MMNAKRDAVLVADDHSLYRTGLSYLLKDRLGFNTVVEVATFDAALDRLSELDGIGLALFDLAMPGVSANAAKASASGGCARHSVMA